MVSCNVKKEKQNTLLEVMPLVGEPILKEEYAAISLHFVDSLLLVRQRNKNHFFRLYDREENCIGTIGKRGDGPDEWRVISTTGQLAFLNGDYGLYLTERSKSKLYCIDLHRSINRVHPIVFDEYTVSPDLMLDNFLVLSDSSIVGNCHNMRSECLLAKVSTKDSCVVAESVKTFSIRHLDQLSAPMLNTLFLTFTTINQDRTRIACAFNYFDRIDIYRSDLTLFKTITLSAFPTQIDGKEVCRAIMDEQNENHYHGICSTEKYIYALYRKETEIDYGENTDIGSEIRVFDWNGELIRRYSVSDYLMSIAVDEKKGNLYGLDFYNEKILKYSCIEK